MSRMRRREAIASASVWFRGRARGEAPMCGYILGISVVFLVRTPHFNQHVKNKGCYKGLKNLKTTKNDFRPKCPLKMFGACCGKNTSLTRGFLTWDATDMSELD